MIRGHHVPTQNAAPTYAAARPVYIGFAADPVWAFGYQRGHRVVPYELSCGYAGRSAAPDPLSASPAIVRTAPTVFVTGRPGKGNGQPLSAARVLPRAVRRRVAAGQGRGRRRRSHALRRRGSGLSLMVRLLGDVSSVSMLSLPPQLLRAAAAASPGISRSPDPTARARRALVRE